MYLKFSFGLLAIVLMFTVFLLASGTAAAEVRDGGVPKYCGAINSNSDNGSPMDTVYVFVHEGDSDLCYSFLESTSLVDDTRSNDDDTTDSIGNEIRLNDKKTSLIDNSARSTDNGGRSTDDNTRSIDTPRPIRTITEGGSTTFTVPTPSANDRRIVTQCASFAGTQGRATPTPQFRPDGTLVCDYSIPVPYVLGVAQTAGTNSVSTFGPCRGSYTVEVFSRDNRITTTNGNRIRVTTTPSGQGSDDTGTVEVEYFLVGTSTNTFAQTYSGATVHTSTSQCKLQRTAHVEVRPGTRPGMTAAVAMHAPAQEFLSTPQTVTWTCTAELMAASTCPTVGDEITKTTQPTFPTPSGCRIIVTVSQNRPGHGSTGCLTNDEAASFGDVIDVDIDSLPSCPLSTAPQDLGELEVDSSGRQRCVARN